MDGEQETNATPTSFFRGISDKLDSQQRQQGLRGAQERAKGNGPSHSSVTFAHYSNHTRATGNSNVSGVGGNVGGAAVAPVSLITQVAPQPSPSSVPTSRGGGGARAGSYGDAGNNNNNHGSGNNNESHSGGASNTRVRVGSANSGSNANNSNSAAAVGSRQRVHATELVERARYIRNQPKNTSPIDASAHPSLLPEPLPQVRHRKCLILDVDETLVHSSYQSNTRFDVHLPIQLDRETQVNVYVAFRPHLSHFLEVVAPLFEVVIFTASLSTYCDPLMNSIDANNILGGLRLFREHCSVVGTTYVKDLSLLGRHLDHVAIIDNSPIAYLFQQRNAIPITSWFDDPNDEELLRLIPVLEALAEADTVYDVLDNYNALLQLQQFQEGNNQG